MITYAEGPNGSAGFPKKESHRSIMKQARQTTNNNNDNKSIVIIIIVMIMTYNNNTTTNHYDNITTRYSYS